jgi:hypothetical protein
MRCSGLAREIMIGGGKESAFDLRRYFRPVAIFTWFRARRPQEARTGCS